MSEIQANYNPADHYDRVTEAWLLLMGSELHYGLFTRGDEPLDVATATLTNRMIEAAGLVARSDQAPQPRQRVLDVGCGSGAPACKLATQYNVDVVGITTSSVGVAEARARASSLGIDAATFEQRDGTDNGFPDNAFDLIWVLESSHLMRDRRSLLSESARVLRPGGRIVLCDLISWRSIPFLEVRERRVDFATLRAAFGDAHFESLAFYAETMESNGLVVDRVDDLTAATLPTFDRWRSNAEMHSEAVTKLIGADGLRSFVRSCDLLEEFWNDRTFGYGIISAVKSE